MGKPLRTTVKAASKDHEQVRAGEKPYDGETCKKAFNTNGTLSIHKMIHDEPRKDSDGFARTELKLQ